MASLLSPDPGYYIWIDVILHLPHTGMLGTGNFVILGVTVCAAPPFPMLPLRLLWHFIAVVVHNGGVRCQSFQCHAAAIHITAGTARFHNGGYPTSDNCARSASIT